MARPFDSESLNTAKRLKNDKAKHGKHLCKDEAKNSSVTGATTQMEGHFEYVSSEEEGQIIGVEDMCAVTTGIEDDFVPLPAEELYALNVSRLLGYWQREKCPHNTKRQQVLDA